MAVIDIVTTPLARRQFTGGAWCVIQYAHGLSKLGHDVRVIPSRPSPLPDWLPADRSFEFVIGSRGRDVGRALLDVAALIGPLLRFGLTGRGRQTLRDKFGLVTDALLAGCGPLLSFEHSRAQALAYVRRNLRRADVTLATHFETALPVMLYGAGRKLYFIQHFEPYFWRESRGRGLSKIEARASYRLGLEMIANSSWLKARIEAQAPGARVQLCCNAVNHEYFWPAPVPRVAVPDEMIVISYGGREAVWKGFRDMAEAMQLVRSERPAIKLRWRVFGAAILPPDNTIAAYEALGFLAPPQLADAYRDADLLLSASWYESFPLFPLEAMACGIAVVTTPQGTQDFAIGDESAELVSPQDPRSIADGLLRLIDDPIRRQRLARRGVDVAAQFTWAASVQRMHTLIENGAPDRVLDLPRALGPAAAGTPEERLVGGRQRA